MTHENASIVETDFNFDEFVEKIYQEAPKPAFTYHMEFLEVISADELRKLLAYFVMTGAKRIYNKELSELLPNEIEHLREYLISIGYKVEFKVESRMQRIDPKNPNKETLVNYFLIDFIRVTPKGHQDLYS